MELEESKTLKDILEKYGSYQNGLLLFDAPTGVGKTTAALEFIIDYLKGEISIDKKKILYITNLKTNLPYEKLKEKLQDQLYLDKCGILKPYYEMLLDSYDIFIKCPIDTIKNLNEYKILKKHLENEKKLEELILDDDSFDKHGDYLNNILHVIQNESEPAFRSRIKQLFYYNNLSTNQTQTQAREWIEKIYITKLIFSKKILFMSTSRFISPIDLFDEGVSMMYLNEKFIRDTLIIIDEFDSSKQVILSSIINGGIKQCVNLTSLFVTINHLLNETNLSQKLLEYFKEDQFVLEIIDKNKSLFNEYFTKYKLYYTVKQQAFDNRKNFIFCDEDRYYFSNNKYLIYRSDALKKSNIIFDGGKNQVNNIDVFSAKDFILDIVYSIEYFSNGMKLLASKFMQNYNNLVGVSKLKKISFEEAVKSILSFYRFSEEYSNYLYDKILYSQSSLKEKMQPQFKRFFENGFAYIVFEDSDRHLLDTHLQFYDFYITPEQIIYNLSVNTLIIGMSATATIDSTIGNYNLDFFHDKLKDKFYVLNQEDRMVISQLLQKKEHNYINNISSIKIHCLNKENKYKEENLDLDLDRLNIRIKDYYKTIIEQMIVCYVSMIKENIQSMILFLNTFDLSGLKLEDFKKIIKNNFNDETTCFFALNSDNFNQEFKNVKSFLKKGKKVFIWTTYKTIGTGKNIQYDLPLTLQNYSIDNTIKTIEKDFDAIYICKPTYLIESYDGKLLSHEELNKKISMMFFQLEYLYKNRNISGSRKQEFLKGVVRALSSNDRKILLPQTFDYFFQMSSIIIQAIGRICRTPNKSKVVHIYADEGLIDQLSCIKEFLNKKILNKEFLTLMNFSQQKKYFYSDFKEINDNAKKYIEDLRHNWTEEKVRLWKELREFTLMYPTGNGEAIKYKPLFQYYFKLGQEACGYWLLYDHKYHKIATVQFINNEFSDVRCGTVISEYRANLNYLMKNRSISDYFQDKRYARKFYKNRYIMSPVIFQSIYLAALGEICGKIIVEEVLDISLEELPIENYELFDYRLGDIYFDFKNWIFFRDDRKKQTEHILNKLAKVQGRLVFIINVFNKEHYDIPDGNSSIIEIPSLLIYDSKNDKTILDKEAHKILIEKWSFKR